MATKKDELEKALKEIAEKERKDARYLEPKMRECEWIDKQIVNLEAKKQAKLSEIEDLLEVVGKPSHRLKNGYTVKRDDKLKVRIKSTKDFLLWLKNNREPAAVMAFFEGALKLTALKKFCEKEYNRQRDNGVMKPKIDGVEYGEVTYRRLTTEYKK